MLKLLGPHAWAAAAAVGLSILAMYVTGTFHPPAGINPLLVVSGNLPWTFLFVPVLAGAAPPVCAGAGLASLGPPPALAAALAVVRYGYRAHAGWALTASRSVNRSPSRTMATWRWWKASSVERWPIDTMVVRGRRSFSSR